MSSFYSLDMERISGKLLLISSSVLIFFSSLNLDAALILEIFKVFSQITTSLIEQKTTDTQVILLIIRTAIFLLRGKMNKWLLPKWYGTSLHLNPV